MNLLNRSLLLSLTLMGVINGFSQTPLKKHKNELKSILTNQDSIFNEISRIKIENSINSEKIRSNSTIAKSLVKQSQRSEFYFFKDFLYPILLSIIAGFIFWLIFSYFPESNRRKKIRPKLDLDIYYLYSRLFQIFDSVLRFNKHSPSYYQEKIRGNKLSKDDINLGLQNKCLNETYFYDSEIKNSLLPIGEELYDTTKKIDLTIDRLYRFSNNLTSEEILLLENIRKKLETYDLSSYERQAFSTIGEQRYYPVVPNLSYMTDNIFELYGLFISLQNHVFKSTFENRDISISKIQHYYYSGQFSKCKTEIKKIKNKYPNDKHFLGFYDFGCEYYLHRNRSYGLLKNLLTETHDLISNRGFIKDFLNDPKVKEILENLYNIDEIQEMIAVLQNEDEIGKGILENSIFLKDYFAKK